MRTWFIILLVALAGCTQLLISGAEWQVNYANPLNWNAPSLPCGNTQSKVLAITNYPQGVTLAPNSYIRIESQAQGNDVVYNSFVSRIETSQSESSTGYLLMVEIPGNLNGPGYCGIQFRLNFISPTTTTTYPSVTTTTLIPTPIINESDGIIILIMGIAVLVVLVV